MKNLLLPIILFALVFAATPSFAQLRKIPAEVTSSFSEKFPGAANVEWRDKLSGFTASFTNDTTSFIASFNNKGEWESTEQSIQQEELPQAVLDGLDKSKYTEWEVNDVILIELPEDEIQYRIVVTKGDIKKRNLYFSTEGRMLKDKMTL